ncbi:hypothetical protein TNIN_319591 [Trichonephila inaurata madagascariensis]|uniref:Uncharacterized protein n=1 Tax=Trichonephila inaurata madagascariensis TaxID=2747483 RepID=A0A8X6WMU3_9ARAC|nr:hypothetical protein TNIN_319591 [Trichonephila inaurata madagascariensis]
MHPTTNSEGVQTIFSSGGWERDGGDPLSSGVRRRLIPGWEFRYRPESSLRPEVDSEATGLLPGSGRFERFLLKTV